MMGLVVFYAFGVILLHVIPTGGGAAFNQTEISGVRGDYILHMVLFLPWMPLVWYVVKVRANKFSIGLCDFMFGLMTGMILAVCAEGLQYWIPYRSFNPMDMIFNVTGVLLGSLIFLRRVD